MTGPLTSQEKNANGLLSSAIYEEEVTGKLGNALNLFLQLLDIDGIDRSITAKALYHLGLVNEKLGNAEAGDYYKRLIDNYPEQKELLALARLKFNNTKDTNMFLDTRDGHQYHYVTVNSQTWMAENLAYIDHVNPMRKQEGGIWVYGYDGRDAIEAKSSYNYQTFGCLYDWATAMGHDSTQLDNAWQWDSSSRQGICPPGWHLPSYVEWKVMKESQSEGAGKNLKSSRGWPEKGIGENLNIFGSLPGGFRQDAPPYYYTEIGTSSKFWTASNSYLNNRRLVANSVNLTVNSDDLVFESAPITHGFSVRCVKDLKDRQETNSKIQTHIPVIKAKLQKKSVLLSDPRAMQAPNILWTFQSIYFHGEFAVSGGKVFPIILIPSLQVLNVQSGEELWRYTDLGLLNQTIYLAENKIYLQRYYPEGVHTIIAVDTADHQRKLQLQLEQYAKEFKISNERLVCLNEDSSIIVYDLLTQKIAWSLYPSDNITTSLAVSENLILAGIRNPLSAEAVIPRESWYLSAYDLQTGDEKWKFGATLPFNSKPVIDEGFIYIGSDNGYLYCINLLTGKQKWRVFTDNEIKESPVVGNGMVFIGSTDNFFYALDKETGCEIWKYAYKNSTNKWQPAVSDSLVLFVSIDKNLYALDPYTGLEKWKHQFADDFKSSPVIMDGIILIAVGKTLYALK